jgi:hypothetical protein
VVTVKKLIGIVLVIVVAVLLVLAYLELGRKTAQEGKAVMDIPRESVDRTRQSAEEMNKRTEQTNREVKKILGDEKE